MHVYIYDSFVNQKKYNNALAKIETRITDLGLNGKICRLGLMTKIQDTIQNEIKRGAKTLIVVGNDQTINQAVNVLAGSEIPLGIIPVGDDDNLVAQALGIEPGAAACDTLSARRIERLDLGLANNYYFLTNAMITGKGTVVEINRNYSIEILDKGEIYITNLPPASKDSLPTRAKFDPQDGKLELYIKTEAKKKIFQKVIDQSVFQFEKIIISNNDYPLLIDNAMKVDAPVEISIYKKALNVIVGKNRYF